MTEQCLAESGGVTSESEVADLETEMQAVLNGVVHGFRLTLEEGRMVLRGQSRTKRAKDLVQQVILEAASFSIFTNEIVVN